MMALDTSVSKLDRVQKNCTNQSQARVQKLCSPTTKGREEASILHALSHHRLLSSVVRERAKPIIRIV